jgi:hypothetical protein
MIEKIDPDKTVAVVVGIEKYDSGTRWDLNGPASDALRFVRWLRQRGVPKTKILLFLSPLDQNQGLSEMVDVPTQSATRDLIQQALAQQLNDDPALTGDLFFLFWGGHGVMEADQKRRMFYANASDHNKLVLDLDSLLGMLRSKDRRRRFKFQVGIIDACANYFEEMRHKLSLADAGFSTGDADTLVKQFIMYAAAAGERAKNEDIRRTGAFSEVVLKLLEETPQEQWPPDMAKVSETVSARCKQLQKENKINQTPVRFQWQDWEGNQGAVGEFNTGYDRLSDVSTVRSLLRDVDIRTSKLRQLYLRSAPSWQRAPEVSNLDQMLERLWEMMPRDQNAVSPLLEFAERIARAQSLDDLSEKIIDVVKEKEGGKNQIEDLREKIRQEKSANIGASSCHLLIDICDPDLKTKELRFPTEIRYWVITSDNAYGDPKRVVCENASPEQVRDLILRIIAQVEGDYGRPAIELFVHHNWLCCDADQWERPGGLLDTLFDECESEDSKPRLGDSCNVVLRWGNRAMEVAKGNGLEKLTKPALWKNRVALIRKNQALCGQPDVFWITQEQKQRDLEVKFSDANHEPCTGFSFVPFDPHTSRVKPPLMAALVSGAAFALWPRREAGDEQTFRQLLQNAVRSGELDDLPQIIKQLRSAALADPQHPGCALTLFWDDPDRNPLTITTNQPD